jgi:hypothetical protein
MNTRLLDPKPGEKWHYPAGADENNPAARSVTIVCVITDEHVKDHNTGGALRLVVTRELWKDKGKYFWEIHKLWLWERITGGWAPGPLTQGGR